jgi:hypothetical protein
LLPNAFASKNQRIRILIWRRFEADDYLCGQQCVTGRFSA